jgi:hypothetical protein
VLAGLMHHNHASVLVFDMHNEYGYDDTASDTGLRVTGLKTKFASRVRVVGLGAGTTIRGSNPDFNLEIAMGDITSADIELLTRELNLKETTPTSLHALTVSFGRDWFRRFKGMNRDEIEVEDEKTGKVKKVPHPDSVAAWADEAGVNVMAVRQGIYRRETSRRCHWRDHQVARGRPARHPVVRTGLRDRPGLPAGLEPAHPQDQTGLGEQDQPLPLKRQG